MDRAVARLGLIGWKGYAFCLGLVCCVIGTPASAQTNLVKNGTFAVTGGTTSFQFGTGYSNSLGESLADWTTSGYNFVFLPGSITAKGSGGNLSLWSPSSSPSSANGFTNESPTDGNFVAADSDYETEAITQSISGLVVGKTYTLSFAWAGAQQSGFTGATEDQWQVTLGSTTQDTSIVDVASEGFSGWMTQTFSYVATATTETLSFLASGSPAEPPFVLLANVSLTLAPEPASIAVMVSGLVGLIGVARRRAVAHKARSAA